MPGHRLTGPADASQAPSLGSALGDGDLVWSPGVGGAGGGAGRARRRAGLKCGEAALGIPVNDRRATGPVAAALCVSLCLAVGAVGAHGSRVGVSGRATAHTRSAIGLDASGGFVVGGKPTFLIALSNPPSLTGRTPTGLPGLAEVVRAGVNLLRVGPTWTGWTHQELWHVLAWERTAVSLRVHLWVRLNAFAATQPRWVGDGHLAAVVHELTRSHFSAAIGLWQGADEPWSRGIPARALAFGYCRLTSRGDARACAGEPSLDRHHLLLTILAPSGSSADLAPYGDVSDGLGVDDYPVTLLNPRTPDLHQVGVWTSKIAAISRRHLVWTTLQICSIHQWDRETGAYVVPSAYQERYMVYDAVINGARGIAFFGGGNPACWNRADRRYGWNWTFWNRALAPLIEQIGPHSRLGPALANAASNHALPTTQPGAEAVSRVAVTSMGRQLWVVAARSSAGSDHVSISGLPASAERATVYGERRVVRVKDGTLRDTFRKWQVHVYRIQLRL